MKDIDVIIAFPPVTEARLFPYLSLPMITGYLRKKKVKVKQVDLNIELCHSLFDQRCFNKYIANNQNNSDLKDIYKVEMAKFLSANQERLYKNVFVNKSSSENLKYDVRLVRQGIELLLSNSFLKAEFNTLKDIMHSISNNITESDIATSLMYKNIKNLITKYKPKMFAVSIAYYSQILPSLLLSRWIKESSPSTHVILGGQQIMIRHAQFKNLDGLEKYVDSLGVSAGEETMFKLVKYINKEGDKEDIPDIVWLDNHDKRRSPIKSTYHLKDAPPPDFTDLPFKNYLDEEYHMPLITCIGCYWGRCTFCSYGNRSRKEKNYQQKTAKQIAEECEYIIKKYAVNRINFIDENTNLRLVVNAMKILHKRGYKITFSTRNRMEEILLDKNFCQELKDLGCILMSVGYETNSQRILDIIDKGVEAYNYQKVIDNLHQVGITLRFSIIGGFPDESEEEIQESEAFLIKNANKIGIDVMQMLVAEPGTYLYENAEKFNLDIRSRDILRGNKILNYGMGRMGATFDYSDGDTFDNRLNRFIEIFEKISPQKNDELPPERYVNESLFQKTKIIKLNHWVKVVNYGKLYIFDFLWQRVFLLPTSIKIINNYLFVDENKDVGYLDFFVQKGLGKYSEREVKELEHIQN